MPRKLMMIAKMVFLLLFLIVVGINGHKDQAVVNETAALLLAWPSSQIWVENTLCSSAV